LERALRMISHPTKAIALLVSEPDMAPGEGVMNLRLFEFHFPGKF